MVEEKKKVEDASKVKKNATKEDDKKKKDGKKVEEELSEEDLKLKEDLTLMVERAQDADFGVQKLALESMRKEIRSATSSMTSVPKPLKFLRPHYDVLKATHTTATDEVNKKALADILSVLAMTMSEDASRESLKYKLLGNEGDSGDWGHEYVRNLSGEISAEYQHRKDEVAKADQEAKEKEDSDEVMDDEEKPAPSADITDLHTLIKELVQFCMSHHAEPEACDLLMEVDEVAKIVDEVDERSYRRVCLYLESCALYVPEPEDAEMLRVTLTIYRKYAQVTSALVIAIRLNDMDVVRSIYHDVEDVNVKKQIAYMLARENLFTVLGDEGEEDDEIQDLLNNTQLSEKFLTLGKDLNVAEPKSPEDIYKTHLTESRVSVVMDSARQNLASTYVNGFVNCGFGTDTLMMEETPAGGQWIYKNKEHGMMGAAASLGLILLWDVDGGLTQIDKYLYSKEDYVKAGALLAVGVVNAGVRNDCDPALALLSDYIQDGAPILRVGAIMGLGQAYAGTSNQDVVDLLIPVVEDITVSIEVLGVCGLALGLICTGSGNGEVTQSIIETLMQLDDEVLAKPHARFLSLGLALLYLGKQEEADVALEALKVVQGPMGKYAQVTVETCAYTGSGNVLQVQKMLQTCGEHLEKDDLFQAAAVLGIAQNVVAEDISCDMAIRALDHLLQYGEPAIRRAVPLALGLLCVSDPRVGVMDTLSKLSHDTDAEVAQGAIMALGVVSAGSNNSRAAQLLQQLAAYYAKEPNHLFVVRIAQGLLHLGKGLLTLSPLHSHNQLLSKVGMAGLITFFHACLDFKDLILSEGHYFLFALAPAIQPRMLMTLDENLQPLPISVRVGQPVDTVGQAGKPKTITGFQTNTTPVLLSRKDRAELATDEYIAVSHCLEGFVIVKPNPDSKTVKAEERKKAEAALKAEKKKK
eukprot:TRINITY_DN1603_c0_g2_i1.p1 TRINITY_DN1603_c0_g2~~TRINITY_DN1603_c0_g2_i1.p1  ORF type:complete len:924 (-),score=320.63 TRINITY_DN1603_c0_g2_i1:72-2843(-)